MTSQVRNLWCRSQNKMGPSSKLYVSSRQVAMTCVVQSLYSEFRPLMYVSTYMYVRTHMYTWPCMDTHTHTHVYSILERSIGCHTYIHDRSQSSAFSSHSWEKHNGDTNVTPLRCQVWSKGDGRGAERSSWGQTCFLCVEHQRTGSDVPRQTVQSSATRGFPGGLARNCKFPEMK